ncbi:hypothetical protein ACLOJK_040325 [Asimina triloba]
MALLSINRGIVEILSPSVDIRVRLESSPATVCHPRPASAIDRPDLSARRPAASGSDQPARPPVFSAASSSAQRPSPGSAHPRRRQICISDQKPTEATWFRSSSSAPDLHHRGVRRPASASDLTLSKTHRHPILKLSSSLVRPSVRCSPTIGENPTGTLPVPSPSKLTLTARRRPSAARLPLPAAAAALSCRRCQVELSPFGEEGGVLYSGAPAAYQIRYTLSIIRYSSGARNFSVPSGIIRYSSGVYIFCAHSAGLQCSSSLYFGVLLHQSVSATSSVVDPAVPRHHFNFAT